MPLAPRPVTRAAIEPEPRPWPAFARTFVATAAGLALGYLAAAYAIDPYDSGRSHLLSVGAVRPQGPRTAAAMRGRDPAFSAAIIGNSHIQPVEPQQLSEATGIPFVQLSVIASEPREQLTLMDWFLRHHREPRALVLGADAFWCTDDPDLRNSKPFPFWLFAADTPGYLRGLMRWSVAQEVAARLGWLARGHRREARRDGWWDNEADYLALIQASDPRIAGARDKPVPDAPDPGRAGPAFPAADRFGAVAAALPGDTALVLVFPPVYAPSRPRPGSPRAAAEEACEARIAAAARHHPRTAIIDGRRDRPALHDPEQFFDQTHYRRAIGRALAEEIAGAIGDLTAGVRPGPPVLSIRPGDAPEP